MCSEHSLLLAQHSAILVSWEILACFAPFLEESGKTYLNQFKLSAAFLVVPTFEETGGKFRLFKLQFLTRFFTVFKNVIVLSSK